MVNTGKPSKACKNCLVRRIKCDETKPACRKCQKTRRVCGYRDPFEIKLRDETQSTIRKAQSASQRRGRSLSDLSAGSVDGVQQWPSISPGMRSSASSEGMSRPDSSQSIPRSPQISLKEQAECFFLSNFILTPDKYSCGGMLNFIMVLMGDKDSTVKASFDATAMAALASRPNSRSLLPKAHSRYTQALAQVKEALKNTDTAKRNQTLASVILLSIYEGLVAQDEGMDGWCNHMSGARTLIKMRGVEDVTSTKEGLDMLVFVRSTSIRQYSFGFLGTITAEEVDMWSHGCTIIDGIGHQPLMINLKTALMRAEADALFDSGTRTAKNIEKALELHRECKAMATELGVWVKVKSPEYKTKMLEISGSAKVARFPSIWVAAKLLNCHASRILLAGIMVRCIRWISFPADFKNLPDYAETVLVGRSGVHDIISSMPYFMTWTGDETCTPNFLCGQPTVPKMLGAISCLWPLLITGKSEFATEDQKRHIRNCLSMMAGELGIGQAEHFAKFISQDVSTSPIAGPRLEVSVAQPIAV